MRPGLRLRGHICLSTLRLKSLRCPLVLHFVFLPFPLHHSSNNRVVHAFSFLLTLACSADIVTFYSAPWKKKKILIIKTLNINPTMTNMHFFSLSFLQCCCRKGAAAQTEHDELPALLISAGSTHGCAALLPNCRMSEDEQS